MLKNLCVASATGPDGLPARVLRECAEELALPVTLLVRRLLRCGRWLTRWRLHWVLPLHKRKAVFNPSNYRGAHLTTVLSKVVERVLLHVLAPYCQASNAFGDSQFAFQKNLSCNDLVAALVCSWVLAFENREKVGVYLSDISGAFDRVEKPRLLAKLKASGLNDTLLQLLSSYLEARKAVVLVNGQTSEELELADMVFQGTVLGPTLWNMFFKDVTAAAESTGGTESKFADDLSVWKTFPATTPNSEVLADLRSCQEQVHRWGALNRVSFDRTKEELLVLHPLEGEGEDFRLLGPLLDVKLQMHSAVQKVAGKARAKLHAVLKTKRYYNTDDLVLQFKTHVLCLLETVTPAVYHASSTALAPLNKVLETFCREVGLSKEEAFLLYNLAPLPLRRDVAMLGLLHKCTLKSAHPRLQALFPPAPPQQATYRTRRAERRHNKQLLERCTGRFLELTRRSAFGLVRVYNFLPEDTVCAATVTGFQTALAKLARAACETGNENWEKLFCPRSTLQG